MNIQLTREQTSFQGTGRLLGVRQYFVRFAGCSIKRCPIRKDCDERYSLNPMNGYRIDVQEVVDKAVAAVGTGGWLHVTGGEPTDQAEALERLVQLAHRGNLRVHLQTAGLTRLELPFDWITVSPKVHARHLEQRTGQELVLVYEEQHIEEILAYSQTTHFSHYFIQPKWIDAPKGEALNNKETLLMAHELNAAGDPWQLTLQAHKYVGAY